MSFEVVPTNGTINSPRISIRKAGDIFLNPAACITCGLVDAEFMPRVDYVVLMYNKDSRKVAICPTSSKKTYGARRCHWLMRQKRPSLRIMAKMLLDDTLGERDGVIYIDEIEYDKAADMIIFQLPQKLR